MNIVREPLFLENLKIAYNDVVIFSQDIKTRRDKAGAVKAFEYAFELAWKSVRRVLQHYSIECIGSRDAFRKGGQRGLIDNVEQWLKFVDLRNITSHVYGDEEADLVLKKLPVFQEELKQLIDSLEKVINAEGLDG